VTDLAPFPMITKRLKYVVSLRRSRVEGAADDRPYIGLENIESTTGQLIGEPVATDESALSASGESESLSNTFETGDVLFGKLRPYLAKAWVAAFQGRCTTELLVMQPVETESRFLRYVCLSRDFIDAVDASTFGSKMPRADWDFIGNMPIPMPPLPQQSAIAEYLDHETARLDALVKAKERVLGLLAEKRRALITRAVTRGLDPHIPLRDSGIPWLGEIPAYWKVVQLKFTCVSLQTGPFGSQLHSEDYVTGGIPVVNPSHLNAGRIYADDRIAVDEATAERLAIHRLRLGDLVFARRGEMGRCGVVEADNVGWLCGTGSLRARIRADIADPYYLAIVFTETRISDVLSVQSVGSTMDNLNTEILGSCHVPIPPLAEQHNIVSYIVCESAKLDAVYAATERSALLLRERRGALIAAAVTGQLEVA